MTPKISVVIPALNEEKLLPRCLKSLQKQTYPKDLYEIIVVDNGSTDHTAAIAREFGAYVYPYTEKHAYGSALQYGTTKARGDIIAIIDADSYATSNWLSLIDKTLSDPNLVCVGGKAMPDKKSALASFVFKFYDWFYSINHGLFHKTLVWGFNLAVKKAAFQVVGEFDVKLPTSNDWDLVLRLQKKFGFPSVIYERKLLVYTSIRKQQNIKILWKYAKDGLINYTNIVWLRKTKSTPILNVR